MTVSTQSPVASEDHTFGATIHAHIYDGEEMRSYANRGAIRGDGN